MDTHQKHSTREKTKENYSAYLDSEEFWNKRYSSATSTPVFGELPRDTLVQQFPTILSRAKKAIAQGRNYRIFEIGFGQGRNCIWLLKQLSNSLNEEEFCHIEFVGVDISGEAVSQTTKLAISLLGEHFVQQNMKLLHDDVGFHDEELQHSNIEKYDLILGFFIQFIQKHDILHQKIEHALKYNGMIIINGYTPEQLQYNTGGPQEIDHLYTSTMLKQEFPHCEPITAEDKIEQVEHPRKGQAAICTFVAIKTK